MEPFILEQQEFLKVRSWTNAAPRLVAGFTTVSGGVSKEPYESLNMGFHVGDSPDSVRTNRAVLSEAAGFPLQSWVCAEQTHGINIRKITLHDRGTGAEKYNEAFRDTDGFYTDDKGVLLSLCYADCVPLYFFDQDSGRIGVAHAGWKGTTGGIAGEMIKCFTRDGSRPENILAVIGPSICKTCYIVDKRVIDEVEKILDGVEQNTYNQVSENEYELDLKKVNQLIMLSSGLKKENISVTEYCTSCDSGLFFSHRRDKGLTGRMSAFIGWKEEAQSQDECKK